eukprot:RCo047006
MELVRLVQHLHHVLLIVEHRQDLLVAIVAHKEVRVGRSGGALGLFRGVAGLHQGQEDIVDLIEVHLLFLPHLRKRLGDGLDSLVREVGVDLLKSLNHVLEGLDLVRLQLHQLLLQLLQVGLQVRPVGLRRGFLGRVRLPGRRGRGNDALLLLLKRPQQTLAPVLGGLLRLRHDVVELHNFSVLAGPVVHHLRPEVLHNLRKLCAVLLQLVADPGFVLDEGLHVFGLGVVAHHLVEEVVHPREVGRGKGLFRVLGLLPLGILLVLLRVLGLQLHQLLPLVLHRLLHLGFVYQAVVQVLQVPDMGQNL